MQVLTNAGALLDCDKQIAVVSQFTSMIADAAHDPALAERTWVLLTEAVPGGGGWGGHANTNDELVAAARKQDPAELQAKAGKRARLTADLHCARLVDEAAEWVAAAMPSLG